MEVMDEHPQSEPRTDGRTVQLKNSMLKLSLAAPWGAVFPGFPWVKLLSGVRLFSGDCGEELKDKWRVGGLRVQSQLVAQPLTPLHSPEKT